MPTYGWVHEQALERALTGVPARPVRDHALPVSTRIDCPFGACGRSFADEHTWRTHVAVEHPIEPPVLLLHGRVCPTHEIRRARIAPEAVVLANTSRIRLGTSSGDWDEISPDELGRILATTTDDRLELELSHERLVDGARSVRRAVLHIDVPDDAALRAVDAAFIRHLATDPITIADRDAFARATSDARGAGRYRSALGDFALAICSRSGDDRTTLTPVGARHKLRAAADVLTDFVDRPLAVMALGVAHMALVEHVPGLPATGVPALDNAAGVLQRLSGGTPSTPLPSTDEAHSVPLCPVDRTTASLVAGLDAVAVEDHARAVRHLLPLTEDARSPEAPAAMSALLAFDVPLMLDSTSAWRGVIRRDGRFADWMQA